MMPIFGSGIGREYNRQSFKLEPRVDQNTIMQGMYDSGYSVPEIAKYLGMSEASIYARINAHRGRGPGLKPA
ncbi:terminase gpP N-terminus-related DNA-binding protein [Paraburkholderia aspalathi]|uniref:terminase gpP N-terminus-related DNA-binding protein n=2 Tax=Paraburkholderia TaxID=1822464 RepID=UPI0038B9FCF9